jgi:hypothetical protein
LTLHDLSPTLARYLSRFYIRFSNSRVRKVERMSNPKLEKTLC